MTHDPLCPTEQCVICEWSKDDVEWCVTCGGCACELIDKVRADTVKQIWLASKARQAEERGDQ